VVDLENTRLAAFQLSRVRCLLLEPRRNTLFPFGYESMLIGLVFRYRCHAALLTGKRSVRDFCGNLMGALQRYRS
jgi:hypothetical protein